MMNAFTQMNKRVQRRLAENRIAMETLKSPALKMVVETCTAKIRGLSHDCYRRISKALSDKGRMRLFTESLRHAHCSKHTKVGN